MIFDDMLIKKISFFLYIFFVSLQTNISAETKAPLETLENQKMVYSISEVPPLLSKDHEIAIQKLELFNKNGYVLYKDFFTELKGTLDGYIQFTSADMNIYLYPWVITHPSIIALNTNIQATYCVFHDVNDYETMKLKDYLDVSQRFQDDYDKYIESWRELKKASCSLGEKYISNYPTDELQRKMINRCEESYNKRNAFIICDAMSKLQIFNKKN
jgi:hypothetical protein